jgi:chorismate mutase
MALISKKRHQTETDNGQLVQTISRKKRTDSVHRVSLTGPILDPAREQKMLQDIVEKDIFPNCKFINSSGQIDDTSRKSIAGKVAKKMNIPLDDQFQFWWSKQKKFIKTKINSSRTDANSAMRKRYLGMKLLFGAVHHLF